MIKVKFSDIQLEFLSKIHNGISPNILEKLFLKIIILILNQNFLIEIRALLLIMNPKLLVQLEETSGPQT